MKRVTLFLLTIAIATSIKGQTIHAISFANTIDTKVGVSCAVDHNRFCREVFQIANNIGYDVTVYPYLGENCTKENLDGVLSSLRCSKEDIVIFYYTGHGTRSKDDTSQFPQMCLKYTYQEDKFVPVHRVVEKLRKDGARLNLVLTDCCNSVVAGVSTKGLLEAETKAPVHNAAVAANYRKLFVDARGMVVATSSRKGQTSGCNQQIGGFFSFLFFEYALYGATNNKGIVKDVTWRNVLDCTYEVMKSNVQHTPYYVIQLAGQTAPTSPTTTTTSTISQTQPSPVLAENQELAKDIAILLNPTHTMDYRLQHASTLATKWFTPDAKVATMARNGQTILDYEDISDYLRRLAVSSHIKQVNIIGETVQEGGTKINYIAVQEIRK